ncbi:MAG: HRDC domain-containing protein [Holosporaceae bacterium]|jgi:ribonuclease D|nr:HRDC domain-containing protein [Holosporaceae bacterium]
MLLIESSDQLQDFIENTMNEQFIAVDTEFIRENLEKPLLCLVQIATANNVFIIDPIAVDISPLNKIFENAAIRKVFHSAVQDLEILALYGINIKNFYDTQLYEAILSTNASISYQSIVFRYLNKELEKTLSRSNWGKRPLDEEQLIYSANDVLYLGEVYEKQLEKLMKLGRESWLDEELKQMLSFGKEESFLASLNKNNQEVYIQLSEWRTQKAKEKNVPPSSIIRNDVIKAICQKGINFIRNIKNSRNIRNADYKEFLLFAEKIAEKLEIKERQIEQSIIVNLLRTLLEVCSRKHNVAPSIVATSKDLEKLAILDEGVKCLSNWRNEIFGKNALRLLNGEISLRIKECEVIVE